MNKRIVTRRTEGLRIVVFGYIIRGAFGGMVWSDLQYLAGLADLGHDVYYIEDSDDYPSCYNPVNYTTSMDPTYGLKFAENTLKAIGFGNRWAYYDAHTLRWFGPTADQIIEICKNADILLNLAGVNTLHPWLMDIPIRVFIDQDPAFTQVRHLKDTEKRKNTLLHTTFMSFGENIGKKHCSVPDDGLPWQPTRQPIVLKSLPVTPGPANGKLTTIMLWDSYSPCEHMGIYYGMKSDSFRDYMDLPEKVVCSLELAVGSPKVPRKELHDKGWLLYNPLDASRDIQSYLRYINESKAEFSIAKQGYVLTKSGWFSERSATYLACGRPVITQETGFSDWMETGAGIISFNSPEEAVAGINEVNANYKFHCRAAREVAEEYFDARKILQKLIECVMNSEVKRT